MKKTIDNGGVGATIIVRKEVRKMTNTYYFTQSTPHIINTLKKENIPFSIPNDTTIKTEVISIHPNHIINNFTGEILLEYPEPDSIMDYLEYITAIHNSQILEAKKWGWLK